MLKHRFMREVVFQRITLKMIAENILQSCPSTDTDALAQGLYFYGDMECKMLCLKKPVTLIVSNHNPGAASFAEELSAAFDGITIRPASNQLPGRRGSRTWRKFSWLIDLDTSAKRLFLLYLNNRTFLDEAGEQLANQVRAMHEQDPHSIFLVHENDAALGGCDFSRCCCTRQRIALGA